MVRSQISEFSTAMIMVYAAIARAGMPSSIRAASWVTARCRSSRMIDHTESPSIAT